MQKTNKIALLPAGAIKDVGPESEILLNGVSTGVKISGHILEAALENEDNYLLLTTDNYPYDERVHVLFLSRDLEVLDEATVGCDLAMPEFKNLEIGQEISFRFGDNIWTVVVFQSPRSGFRAPIDPIHVSRPWSYSNFVKRFARHFRVSRLHSPDKQENEK